LSWIEGQISRGKRKEKREEGNISFSSLGRGFGFLQYFAVNRDAPNGVGFESVML